VRPGGAEPGVAPQAAGGSRPVVAPQAAAGGRGRVTRMVAAVGRGWRGARLVAAVAVLAAGCTTGAGASADGRQLASPAAPATTAATVAAASVEAPRTTAAPAPPAAPPPNRAAAAAPRFRGSVAPIDRFTRARMRWSWRPGCPVGLAHLRLLRVDHWGVDRRVHRGELVVHRDQAHRVLGVMRRLFGLRYPIRRMRLVDEYRADDDRSMAANNTSAFNCRPVAGTSRWSAHAYGRAIDVNPVQNPYVAGRHVSPPAGRPYANRASRAPGMIHAGDAVVRAFAAAGWSWGGSWRNARDYQHFSASGR
jgi:D-alanyl-D-alanine carboxypeptidase